MIKTSKEIPRLSDEGDFGDVPLIPNSGIQFLDVPLPLDRCKGLRRQWFEEERLQGVAALKPLRFDKEAGGYFYDGEGGADDPKFVATDDRDLYYDLDLEKALKPFLGKWLPLPFLMVEVAGAPGRRKLSPGPQNWARIYIVKLVTPETGGLTHRAVLAFDTATVPREQDKGFLAPRDEPAPFALATRMEEVSWLLQTVWMDGWLQALYRERGTDGREVSPETPIGCRHFASYLTLLAILEECHAIPRVRLINLKAAERQPNGIIDVDLVLDLGNSRSCGYLVEQTPGRDRSMRDAYRLTLRDLSMPESVSDLPFESQIEFARPSFGKEEWSLQSNRVPVFDWPSPVRVGPEALRLSALNHGNEGQTGLSSPKRYLWDEKPRLTPWRFNPATSPDETNRGSYLGHLAEDGTVKSMKPRAGIAMRPMFSRASIFTLFLLEVLLQARSQVNSFAARNRSQDVTAPRRIANLVLTLPPAMPLEEVRKVRERARAAAHLLRDLTGEGARPTAAASTGPVRPINVEVQLDEATATQIVYLYDQVSHAYRGDAPDYFDIAGKPRPDAQGIMRPALRIGSIDVGGGTTDLAIYTYTLNDRVVTPEEEFREGFRLAGDDVLEVVVMRHVLPAVLTALAEAGMGQQRATQFLVSLFRVPASTEPERQARRLALNHLMVPAAFGLLSEYEGWDPIVDGTVEARPMRDVRAAREAGLAAVQDSQGPAAKSGLLRAAAWFNEKVAEAGLPGFDIEAVSLPLDFASVHETIKQTLREALEPLCEIVRRFSCDVLLLSGRGARWPAVTEIVTASIALEPNRIRPMHRYRVGAWYPFADGAGWISDPKTTVVVGAMLHRMLRGGQFDNLSLTDKFGMRSTARYVGLMETDRRIREHQVLFRNLDLAKPGADDQAMAEHPLTFSGSCFLGFKQFAAERWPASPLYRLHLSADGADGVALPIRFTLRRRLTRDQDGEAMEFEIDESSMLDKNDNPLRPGTVVRSLQTLPGDEGSHWLDSGQLATLDAILAALPDHV